MDEMLAALNDLEENELLFRPLGPPRMREVWWDDEQMKDLQLRKPIGLGIKFNMEEALLAFSIITDYHHVWRVQTYIGSLLFEFVVRTLRVPGHCSELLFTTQNYASLEPKPKFEGFIPVNLAAIVRQSINPEITDEQLKEIIQESSPNISEDDIKKCLDYCRPLRGTRFNVTENEWTKPLRRLPTRGREDIGIALLGYIGLMLLRTIIGEPGNLAYCLKDFIPDFRFFYKAQFPTFPVCVTVIEKLRNYFEIFQSERQLILYTCLSIYHKYDNALYKRSVQEMLKSCLFKPCAFKGMKLMEFAMRAAGVYDVGVEEIVLPLWGDDMAESLTDIYRTLVRYCYTSEEKKHFIEGKNIKIPPGLGIEVPPELIDRGPSPYWRFARYFDPESMPQLDIPSAPLLALTLAMIIDEQNLSYGRFDLILGNCYFPPIPDEGVRFASVLADWVIYQMCTLNYANVVGESGTACSQAIKSKEELDAARPNLEMRRINYILRMKRMRGSRRS